MHEIFIILMPLPVKVSICKLKGAVFSLSSDTWAVHMDRPHGNQQKLSKSYYVKPQQLNPTGTPQHLYKRKFQIMYFQIGKLGISINGPGWDQNTKPLKKEVRGNKKKLEKWKNPKLVNP